MAGKRASPGVPTLDEKMKVVFVGHVDHGKSTIVGRLLADTGSLPEGKLDQVRKDCERNSRPFEYAMLIDALRDERSQNITIDSARVFFKSALRYYMIMDAPGHIELIKNMVTGASRAEAALLVIDAQEGVQENSRRHGYLLKTIGVHQLIVLINKMDLVDYQQGAFQQIQAGFQNFLEGLGLQPLFTIPVSGREGDNIASSSARMPWYSGPTILAALDSFTKVQPSDAQPLRLPVQDIYRFTLFGDDRRIVAGSIASGVLSLGDEVIFYPSGKRNRVKTIESFGGPFQEKSRAGQAIGLTLEQQIYIRRGEVIAHFGEEPPKVAKKLRTSLFWLGKEPMTQGKQYVMKLGTAKTRCWIERIISIQDAASGEVFLGRTQISHHEAAEVELNLQSELAFDLAETQMELSRFVIVDGHDICGGGIVLAALPDQESWVREDVLRRNLHWIPGGITLEQRIERFSQKPSMVIITGPKEIDRKKFARELEMRLFQAGRHVYYFGFGSVIYGVDADLTKNGTLATHQEHIRRLSEVVHLLLDTGLIVIVTAADLNQGDLNMIETVLDSESIEKVWIGEDKDTDLHFDIQIDENENPANAATQIVQLMQEHGRIYKA